MRRHLLPLVGGGLLDSLGGLIEPLRQLAPLALIAGNIAGAAGHAGPGGLFQSKQWAVANAASPLLSLL